MDSEPVTAGPSFTVVEKRIEAVAELERAIECGLLMSTTSSLSAAQVKKLQVTTGVSRLGEEIAKLVTSGYKIAKSCLLIY